MAAHPQAENFIRMGVTSIVAGNCGSSALSIGEALDRDADARVAVNFATLIGHNTVRSAVMGAAERDPTLAELDRMKSFVFKGIVDGAVGLSTGLQYVPGTSSKPNEILELARVAANEGGMYATHMRNEGTALEAAIAESIQVGADARHAAPDFAPQGGQSEPLGRERRRVEADRRRPGARAKVQADQYAYTAGASTLSIRFPSWALEGGAEAMRRAPERSGALGEDQERDVRAAGRTRLHRPRVGERRQLSRRIRRSTACR